MKFNDYKYQRPEMAEVKEQVLKIFEEMEKAESKDDFLKKMDEFIQIRLHVESMFQLVEITQHRYKG